jgi:hypothetical protein
MILYLINNIYVKLNKKIYNIEFENENEEYIINN